MKKHFYFIGIGGIGMGALASLLLDKGCKVSGSDLQDNQITAQLKNKGAHIFIGHHEDQIDGAETVVFSSAIKEDNCELKQARAKRIPILQRAQLLAKLMKEHIGITIAGAHGKTTTTSMISQMMSKTNLNPTTAIGGIVNGATSNANLGTGKYFIAEVDESDGSFLNFSPHFSVITNIDFEHTDFYENWNEIIEAYRNFIAKTKSDGLIFAFGEDEPLRQLLQESEKEYKTYGFSAEDDVYAENIMFNAFSSNFDCCARGEKIGTVTLACPGRHNIANALACISLGLHLGIDFNMISDSLKDFGGVKRRFQLIGNIDNIKVIDDYAHHPTEIATTLKTAQRLKDAPNNDRLITIFQPHRYSRLKALLEDFASSLMSCDYLIVTDVYAAHEESIEGVSAQKLCERIQKMTPNPVVYLKKDMIENHLLNMVKAGDVVISLGAGDINMVTHNFAKTLKNGK